MRLINNELIIITNHIVVPLLFDALESLSSFSFIRCCFFVVFAHCSPAKIKYA